MQAIVHDHVEYAGFLRRLLAFMLDVTISGLVSTLLILVLFGYDQLQQLQSITSFENLDWRIPLLEQLIPAIWTIGFWSTLMATPGKLLFDCQVVDATTLHRASIGRLVLRYLGYILSTLALGLGFLWILFDRRNQGWHDKLSGTLVVMQDDSRLSLEELA